MKKLQILILLTFLFPLLSCETMFNKPYSIKRDNYNNETIYEASITIDSTYLNGEDLIKAIDQYSKWVMDEDTLTYYFALDITIYNAYLLSSEVKDWDKKQLYRSKSRSNGVYIVFTQEQYEELISYPNKYKYFRVRSSSSIYDIRILVPKIVKELEKLNEKGLLDRGVYRV